MSFVFNPFTGNLDNVGGAGARSSWQPPVADFASLPSIGNIDGDARVTKDTQDVYVYRASDTTWVLDTGLTIGSFNNSGTANGLDITADSVLSLHAADATNPGAVSTGTQTFAGNKTFAGTLTSQGVLTAQAAFIANTTATVTNTTFANGGVDVTTVGGTLALGTINAGIINIGNPTATVNIQGSITNLDTTNLNVTDALITINSGGPSGSGSGAGFQIEEGGVNTGYFKVSADRNSFILKAPNTAGIATITPGVAGITLDQSSHDPLTLAPVGSTPNGNGATLTNQVLNLELADASNPGLLTSANYSALNAGPANTFIGYDNSGLLTNIPGWAFDSTTKGARVNLTTDPVPGGSTLNYLVGDVSPSADNGNGYTGTQYITNYDPGNSGFNTDFIAGFEIDVNHSGTGTVNFMRSMNSNQVIGDGTLASTVNQLNTFDLGVNISTNAIVHNGTGISFNLNNQGNFVNDYNLLQLTAGGNAIGRNLQGINVNIQAPTTGNLGILNLGNNNIVGGDVNFINLGNSNGSNVTGNVTQISSYNGGTVGGNFQALNLGNNSDVTGYLTGLNYFNSGNVTGNVNMMSLGTNNTGGNTFGGSFIGINSYNNVPIAQNFSGMYLSNNANTGTDMQGLNINLSGTSATGYIQGINVNLNAAVSPGKIKTGLGINDGVIQQGYTYDTSNMVPGAGGVYGINNIGGVLHVAAGFPINDGSFGFGNNIGVSLVAEDDILVDSSGVDLGFSSVGFVTQLGVAAGKTVQTFNMMAAGAGIAAGSGNMINASMFRALGFLPEGGTLNVTNLYGFKADALLDAVGAANLYGVYVDAVTAENYFSKSVAIGTGSKKVANSDVGLEIGSIKAFLPGRLTTTQRNALVPLPGMVIYNTTTNKPEYYNGATWLPASGATSPGDILETGFLAANNQASPVDVTGLAFDNSIVRSAKILLSVYVDATSALYESFELNAIQKATGWEMSATSAGDDSGFTFSITTLGQVQYVDNNYTGFTAANLRFRATTTSV